MKKVYINGCGVLSCAGNSPTEIFNTFSGVGESDFTEKRVYKSVFEKSEMRRMTDYAKLASEVSARCAYDAGFDNIKSRDNSNTGIIFTTGFGASASNIKFFKSVVKKEPDLCNPMTFASMVPNYSLGNVCILLGIKGYSTTLLGGNPFDIAIPVLKIDKVSEMIVGSQEDFSHEFFDSVKSEGKDNMPVVESAVAFWISCSKSENCYAEIIKSGSAAISAFSFLSDRNYLTDDDIWSEISDIIKNENPDVVFGACEAGSFGETEKKIIESINSQVLYINNVKEFFGETLGCSFFTSILSAAVCLKNKCIPFCKINSFQKILVTGTDIQGNYMYILLKAINDEKEGISI